MTETNASGAQVPCISSLGLSVHYTLEGTGSWVAWLRFQASDGSDAILNMHALADTKGPIVRNAILQWCEDHQPNPRADRAAHLVRGTVEPVVGGPND